MASGEIAAGHFADPAGPVPLPVQHVDIVHAPGQVGKCIPVRRRISRGGTQQSLNLPAELDLRIRGRPPFHKLPGFLPKRFILRGNHHGRRAGYEIRPVDISFPVLIHPLSSRNQSEIPQTADFRGGNHQRIVGGISRDADGHLPGTETAHKVVNRGNPVVIEIADIIVKCPDACLIVHRRPGSRLVVQISAVLEEQGKIQRQVRHIGHDGGRRRSRSTAACRRRDADREVIPLNRREHLNQFAESLRDGKLQIFQHIFPVEHDIEGLRLRDGVNVLVQPVLLIGALRIVGKHLLPAVKLREILNRVPQRVVDRLIRAGGKHHIRSPPRQNCVQKGRRIDDLHIYLDSGIRRETLIHQRLQDRTLIAAGENPDFDDFVLRFILVDISHRIVIDEEGSDEGTKLVLQVPEEIRLFLLRRDVRAADHQVIHVQLRIAHVQGSGAQGSDIVLEIDKFQRDLVRLLTEALHLLGNGLGSGDIAGLLAAVSHHIVHDLVQALRLQIHGLHDLRIHIFNMVITVDVRVRPGIDQNPAVNLIQAEGRILEILQNLAHAAQSCFQPDRMLPFRQEKAVRRTIFIRQLLAFPVIPEIEGNLPHRIKRNLPVQQHRPARNAASGIILPAFDQEIVITVRRHLEFPFNPLSAASPGLAADIIQHRVGHGIRNSRGGRTVIFRIKGRLRAVRRLLPLDIQKKFRSSRIPRIRRLLRQVLLIALIFGRRRESQLPDHHRLILRAQGDGILPFLKPEKIGFNNISHIVPEQRTLPVEDLHLAGADLIPLIVGADRAAIRPDSGKCDAPGVLKRQLAVHIDRPLRRDAARFGQQIFYIQIIKTFLRNIGRPGNHGAGIRKQGLLLVMKILTDLDRTFAVVVKEVQIDRSLRFLPALMFRQIAAISPFPLQSDHILRQIRIGILIGKAFHTVHGHGNTRPGHCSRREYPDENFRSGLIHSGPPSFDKKKVYMRSHPTSCKAGVKPSV